MRGPTGHCGEPRGGIRANQHGWCRSRTWAGGEGVAAARVWHSVKKERGQWGRTVGSTARARRGSSAARGRPAGCPT
jgi:hypothetical protein